MVYGRTTDGRVVGRCLFTLTDQGRILTYHRYAHDARERFSAAIDEFALTLATAMNTTMATRGRVSRLVASAWYDDGPVRAGQRWDLFAEDGEVVAALRRGVAEDAESVFESLTRLFGDEDAIGSSLGELLDLPEFTSNGGLVGRMLARFGRDLEVRFLHRVRLAAVAHRHGHTLEAVRAAIVEGESKLLRRLLQSYCRDCSGWHDLESFEEVGRLITDINPSLTVRLLRQTRGRRVRKDEDETDPERRRVLAAAHGLLGRTRLAERLQGGSQRAARSM